MRHKKQKFKHRNSLASFVDPTARNKTAYASLAIILRHALGVFPIILERKVTVAHHCGVPAENTLKSLSSAVMTGYYFKPYNLSAVCSAN